MTQATVIYHQEDDGWWAESPTFPSFFAAGDSYEETKARVWEALPGVAGDRFLGILHLLATSEGTEPASSGSIEGAGTGLRAEGDLVLTSSRG